MSYDNRTGSPFKRESESRFLHPSAHSPKMAQAVPDYDQGRSRGSSVSVPAPDGYTSDSSRYSRARQPINEAVNSAFSTTSAANSAIPADVLAQLTSTITQNVIQQLKATNISAPSPPAPPQHMPPIDAGSSGAGSPPPDRATVYTPPSPYRASEEAAKSSPPLDRLRAGDSDSRDEHLTRPRGPQRISTGGDMTIMERVWGTLFTEHNEATDRLGQFLRGIAVHLIEDYEPKHSLVITPDKMQRYFEQTKLDNEAYPWHIIFDDRTSSISRMYREIEAQHHLVQPVGKLDDRPDIPGLTPRGFEKWATLLIKAHPDQEFDRLVKTALDMPISNPDDKRERFPKEISRRLFPKYGDESIITMLQKAMSTHCNVPLKARNISVDESASSARTRPVQPVQPVFEPPPQSNERLTKSFSHTDSGVVIDDDEDSAATPKPIERERKPYAAAPGGGKMFEDPNAPLPVPLDSQPIAAEPKLSRSLSNAGRNDYPKPRPAPISVHNNQPKQGSTAPVDIPETRRHRNSVYYRDQTAASAPRRNRSPSVSKPNGYGRRSELDQTYNSSYNSIPSIDTSDTARKRRDYDTHRERHATDRFDAARMSAYEPRERERDREREPRPRGNSISGGPRVAFSTDDDYYRGSTQYPAPKSATTATPRDMHGSYTAQPTPTSAQYPPSAFRESRSDDPLSGRRPTEPETSYSREPRGDLRSEARRDAQDALDSFSRR